MTTFAKAAAPTALAPAVHTLHVLTVNTHKGFTALNRRFILPELREAVRSVSADVVFLQEVLGAHERHARRVHNWPEVPHYEFLADSMWPQFAYGRNAVYPDGEHGNALLSKYPIREYANYDVSLNDTEKRGLLHAVLDVPGQQAVHAICVHLGLLEGHRLRQLHLLCELLERIPASAPVIVAGDFNDWRLRADAELARQGMAEVFVGAYGAPARSFPARWPVLRLDRIYLRNATAHAPCVLSKRPWSHLSDHAPLAVEVQL
ncbi:endonuclease/exonuclease/phosphatase family protein [Pseudomonas sp. UL073]|uniref:Endonuclease/exonuclease/phosphatase family protein n=1 Tax=Zestomonas insulae TaxID=2809017 RepID=A0ABS2IIA2_9GAMM|nr:endonuclease/exonuclease/phosphatase family protein [Pseudomonas insulae]MBM7061898.1 endonuclease/exonuclease/phosphatase family protein [Pseudomonas insulae]